MKRNLRMEGYPVIFLFVITFLFQPGCSKSHAPQADLLDQCQQLLLVQANGWNEFQGYLYSYERSAPGEAWKPVFSPFPVVLGLSGIAWGQGLEDYRQEGNQKVEGDKRSPAGIFPLTSVFGYKNEQEAQVLHMPYIHVDDQIRCIEDSKSAWYNQIVSEKSVKPDWKGADHMLRPDSLYSWGAFVGHNPDAVAQGGSCIFMHVWRGPDLGTLGCTAMAYNNMVELVYWLKSYKKPLLVQLPKSEFVQKKEAWNLPEPY
ncbi:MAG: hypothetical protein R3B47_04550 [Bacteroidia bacterium]